MSTHESSLPDPRHASAEELLAHAAWLRRLARSLVADAATADDLVQDTWIAAMRKPPRSDQPIAPWLARVVRNIANSRHRGEQRRVAREAARFVERHEPGSDETAGSLEMQRVLIDAVESLDEPSRSTLVRHYFHAKTSVEIAREDGVAEGTVRWRMKQAIDELKLRLDARHDGDRRAWSAILLPLAHRADVGLTTGTVAAGAATGVILMSTWIKVMVAASIVIAASVGTWFVLKTSTNAEPSRVADASQAHDQLDAPLASKSQPLTKVDNVQPAREVLPQSAPTAAPAAKQDYTAYVEVRVLDALGTPISGAVMTCIDNVQRDGTGRDVAPTAKSAEDGRIRMSLKKSDAARNRGRSVLAAPDTWSHDLELSAPAKAAQVVRVDVKAEGTFSLGDVHLADGGEIAGRTVDANGVPVAGAEIMLFRSDLTLAERDGIPAHGLSAKRPVSTTKSATDGSFAFQAMPTGPYCVWTKSTGRVNFVSDPFEVKAGQTTTLDDLALQENTHAIRGVVIGLDGSPAPRSEVEYTFTDSGSEFWLGVSTNEKGEFVIEDLTTPVVDVYAIGPRPKSDKGFAKDYPDRGQVLVRDVKPGTRDLVLRLHAIPSTRVVVKDSTGIVDEPVRLGIYDLSGTGEATRVPGPDRSVRLLAKPCKLVVGGAGFDEKTLGPFQPGTLPTELEVVLVRQARVSGRVTCAGQPCDGAWINACRVLPADSHVTWNGIPMRFQQDHEVMASTGADGKFVFNVKNAGTWVIFVRHAGLATWESEPLELGPTQGKEGLEIALTHGGAVEGRVTGDFSGAPYVTMSRGAPDGASTRIEADGAFRLHDLTPGMWKAKLTRRDCTEGTELRTDVPVDTAVREIEIVEGKTAHLELDARAFALPTLAGRIAIQGVDMQTWSVFLESKGSKRVRDPAVAIDADGTFRLTADGVGPHHLELTSSMSAERTETIGQDLDLDRGAKSWSLDLATGKLELSPPTAGELVLTLDATNGARWTAHIRKLAGAKLVIDRVPEGRVRIVGQDNKESIAVVHAGIVTPVEGL